MDWLSGRVQLHLLLLHKVLKVKFSSYDEWLILRNSGRVELDLVYRPDGGHTLIRFWRRYRRTTGFEHMADLSSLSKREDQPKKKSEQ
jgi:hypothetical protein